MPPAVDPSRAAEASPDESAGDRRAMTGVGGQWIVDAFGCPADRLTKLEIIDDICRAVIDELQLRVIGQRQAHRFGFPHGVTTLYLLSESHLACHTYPEHGTATFNLVCCRAAANWPWADRLRTHLSAQHVDVLHVPRGGSR